MRVDELDKKDGNVLTNLGRKIFQMILLTPFDDIINNKKDIY